MIKPSFSHLFLPNIVEPDVFANVKSLLDQYINSLTSGITYVSYIHSYVPSILSLINKDLYCTVQSYLKSHFLILENVELHIQPPGMAPIPYHQDNFYHCISPAIGAKIMIPFSNLSIHNGGLIFTDCPCHQKILTHSPSGRSNFSSSIPYEIIEKLPYSTTSYTYNLFDASVHHINSIHHSIGNSSKSASYFVVYRYQSPYVKVDPLLHSQYTECYNAMLHSANILD